jgi:hypothetical protein
MIIIPKTSLKSLKIDMESFYDVYTWHKFFIAFHEKRVYIVHKMDTSQT